METIDNTVDFNLIYHRLKSLKKNEISLEINKNHNKFGVDFLDSMILNSILDNCLDQTPNPIITFIEKYSETLIRRSNRKNKLNKIIKSWHIWFVAIGSFGYFILELVKFILRYCFDLH